MHSSGFTCVTPPGDEAVGSSFVWPLPPEWQAGGEDVGAEPGALLLGALQPQQGDVVVAAVRPVLLVHHNLLHRDLLLVLLQHQRVVVSNPHHVVASVVAIPGMEANANREPAQFIIFFIVHITNVTKRCF